MLIKLWEEWEWSYDGKPDRPLTSLVYAVKKETCVFRFFPDSTFQQRIDILANIDDMLRLGRVGE